MKRIQKNSAHKMKRIQSILVVIVTLLIATSCIQTAPNCPPDKPYYVSVICYESCEAIPFGKYVAQNGSFACYRVPQFNYIDNPIKDVDKRLSPSPSEQCKGRNMGMFWSWVSYQYDPPKFTGLKFSEKLGYKRLKGCGEWQIVNEIHDEQGAVNSHATFAVNEERGVAVLAFKGTEMSSNWKEDFVDWVLSDLDTALVECTVAPDCGSTKLHAGFQKAVVSIKEEILGNIRPYLNAGYLLVVSGHSKGAAMATILMPMSFAEIPDCRSNVYSFTFGSPRTGDAAFVDYYNRLVPDNQTIRFVDRYFEGDEEDMVPSLPFEWMGFRHVKNLRYVHCNKKWFGNPDPIPGIEFQWLPEGANLTPYLGCHFQEAYMDGLLYGPEPEPPKK